MARTFSSTRDTVTAQFVKRCALVFLAFVVPGHAVAGTQQPDVVVREIFNDLLTQLDERRESDTLTDSGVREIFAALLNPRIDYAALSRWILRDHWVNASAEQRSAFRRAFEAYIINTYALALANGQKITLDVKGDPLLRKNTAVVSAAFTSGDADAVPLEFRLIDREERWLLFDVSLSGVSLAKTFRSDFTYVAKDGGIDAVTAHLVQRRGPPP